MKICLYAHNWHYVDNYSPLVNTLIENGRDFEIVVPLPPTATYSTYATRYGSRLQQPYQTRLAGFFIGLGRIPLIGVTLSTAALLWYAKRWLKKKTYSVLYTSDDRIPLSALWIFAAKKSGVSRIILYPTEDIQFVDKLLLPTRAKVRPPLNFKRRLLHSLARRLYPGNFLAYGGRQIGFYTPRAVLEYCLFRFLPFCPWVRGSGKVDMAAVNSQAQFDENLKHGISREKMTITGFPPHDDLVSLLAQRATLRQKICREKELDPKKKTFVILGTHYAFTYVPQEWPMLDELVAQIVSCVVQNSHSEYNIILKVHPRMSMDQQKKILRRGDNEQITFVQNEYSAYELIAISDAILNFFSSTMVASLATDSPIFACKLPNIPGFEETHQFYGSITQILQVSQLNSALRQINDPAYKKQLSEKRMTDRKKFGIFDGQSTARTIKLIES